jgi:hypothetical protein
LWPRYFVIRNFAPFISVDRDHFSKMPILYGPDINASERLTEVAEILAAGLMRLDACFHCGDDLMGHTFINIRSHFACLWLAVCAMQTD